MGKIILLTGGSRSGKSSYALTLAEERYKKRAFIATATPFDDEMEERIEAHKQERENRYTTFEEPFNILDKIAKVTEQFEITIVDCLTVWLGNVYYNLDDNQEKVHQYVQYTFEELQHKIHGDVIFVTNEVGSGIIPENKLARHYRDSAGMVNKIVASIAEEVYLCISGIPVKIKG